MPRTTPLRHLARPSGVLLLSALVPGVGSLGGLALAYRYESEFRESGWVGATLLLVAGALAVGCWLLPTNVLSLLCGWALGLPVGLAIALSAATLGSPLGYVMGRRLAGPGVMRVVEQNPRGAAVCEAIARSSRCRALVLVGLLRLSPVVPYGSTNVLASVFQVPMLPFVAGTLIGLTPRAAAMVLIGAGLERLGQFDRNAIVSPWLFGAGLGATLAALIVMGWVAKRALSSLTVNAIADKPTCVER